MYITILNYETGEVIIEQFESNIDAQEYIESNYRLDNIHYMTTDKLNLNIKTLKEK